jgi:hypothetical protein
MMSVLVALMAAGTAHAALVCPDKLGPAEQIACLQTQNAILQQMIQTKELYKKLDGDKEKPKQRQLDLPVVLSVFGAEGHVQAVLAYAGSSGGSLTVSPGDTLPDGWRVASIRNGRVTIARGGESHILLLSGGAPAQSETTVAGVGSLNVSSPSGVPAFPAAGVTSVPPFGAR